MRVKAVSFYTAGAYAEHAAELSRTAMLHGVALETHEFGPFASWREAVSAKPTFIKEMLSVSASAWDGILWVDSDARFRACPDWSILESCDVAATPWQWTPGHQRELLTGTMFFRRAPERRLPDMFRFLDSWITESRKWNLAQNDTPEQLGLRDALAEHREIAFMELPVEWTWIEPEAYEMFPDKRPIIAHLQASRQLKY